MVFVFDLMKFCLSREKKKEKKKVWVFFTKAWDPILYDNAK